MSCLMCLNHASYGSGIPTVCGAEVCLGGVRYLSASGQQWYLVTFDDFEGSHSEPVDKCPWCGRDLGKKGGGE